MTSRAKPRPDLTNMYVSHEYVLELQQSVGDKVLLGASVHPYAVDFSDRVRKAVGQGAVLLKWLPSAQDIDLASDKAGRALRELAHLGPSGGALPLLLHTGAEYAVPPMNDQTPSLDFHSWSRWDSFWNRFRGSKKWRTPDIRKVEENVRAAVEEGAVIIFAHCGLPYFASRPLSGWLEHSDFGCVCDYLRENAELPEGSGGYFADLSACCTPFRQDFFPKIAKLPPEYLVFGSDFPTPVFELSADAREVWRDFRAMLRGDLDRIVVPQDNLLDVNLRELKGAFQDTPCSQTSVSSGTALWMANRPTNRTTPETSQQRRITMAQDRKRTFDRLSALWTDNKTLTLNIGRRAEVGHRQ